MTTNFENGAGDMSARANPAHTQFNVNDTVLEFNRQYYTMLSTEPERLHNFYGKQSSLLHCLESETDVTVAQGMDEIQQRITSMEYNGVRVVIKNIDCQSSLNGSIFIFVMGVLFWPTGAERKFTQSFVLAQQTNGYYIMNDIMRMTEVEAKPSAPIAAVAPAVPAPPVRTPIAPVAAPQPETAQPAKAAPVAEPKAAEAPAPVKAPAEAKPAPKAPAEPKPAPKTPSSWAELAADRNSAWKSGVIAESKAPAASIVAPKTATPSAPRPAAVSGSRDAPQRAERTGDAARRDQRPSEKRAVRSERNERTDRGERQERGERNERTDRGERSSRGEQARVSHDPTKSVFVSGVQGAATASDVRALFEKCGAVKSFDVLVSKGFAFIEFETEAAQKAALALVKPTCNGVLLKIEPRREARARRDDAKA